MGILIVVDPANCSHLASPRIVRTQKFICALAHAPVILSTEFLDDCLQANERLNPQEYLLKDTEGEERIGHTLADAVSRAKQNKGRMLRGYSIYCTEGVHGGFDTYKAIIEANGGRCLLYRARAGSNTALKASREEDSEDSASGTPEYVYLLSGVTPEEAKIWPKFRQMVEGTGKMPLVVRNDWILNLTLSQEIGWRDIYALTEKDVEVDA